ncbi:hypothetical protein CC80DRAFT_550049 [Byssothecium circinans]|uniref:Uncharacterized protein n=1 Tax=Byssothecium circinans TaxID=147558 RepID=A0A6A5U108_9PLEO|nr:hypothetical protein CC80DRAFT_550049 [Byssothecium circinans]
MGSGGPGRLVGGVPGGNVKEPEGSFEFDGHDIDPECKVKEPEVDAPDGEFDGQETDPDEKRVGIETPAVVCAVPELVSGGFEESEGIEIDGTTEIPGVLDCSVDELEMLWLVVGSNNTLVDGGNDDCAELSSTEDDWRELLGEAHDCTELLGAEDGCSDDTDGTTEIVWLLL